MKPDDNASCADWYLTLARCPETEIKILGSRFVAEAFPARDSAAAREHLAAVRRRYHDATHHCSAYRLAPPENPVDFADDDGEPSGTAGNAILGTIRRAGLYDTIVVVTRYFGGTKLGTGGLARAYADAGRLALEAATIRRKWRLAKMIITCDYQVLGTIEAQMKRAGALVHSAERAFDPEPRIVLKIPRTEARNFADRLAEATAARAKIEITSEECEED